MSPTASPRHARWCFRLVSTAAVLVATAATADDAPTAKKDSPLVKMLRTGKLPEARQGAVVDMIGKRGVAADLTYLFEKVVTPEGLPPTLRTKALNALTEAALTRGVRPEGDLSKLESLIGAKADPATRLAAVRLAELWKVAPLAPVLGALAESPDTPSELRGPALDALAAVGGEAGRSRIDALTGADKPVAVRAKAVATLTRFDAAAAADKAVGVLRDAKGGDDLLGMIAAFLNRQGGADTLAAAVSKGDVPADAAKRALRTVYEFGRSDAGLVTALTKAAGLDAEVKPLDPAAMEKLAADVAAKGDPARGETVFRRADVNCAKCHALSGAGGGVGPDLSAVGASSPVDYLVNSIMLPDQAIKEEFHTLVVLTTDGQVYQGIVADKDAKRIVLKDATGALKTIPTADVDESKEGGSLMPKGLVNFLTRDEFVDLVRFLSELGKPGPYAVRSASTVQRWRFLKPVPADLAGPALDADPSHWLPAYAKTAGDLPLGEIVAESGSPVVYLRAEVDVSQAGKVAVTLNSADGVRAWVDAEPAPAGTPFEAELSAGKHTLTFRVDTAARREKALRVVVAKAGGSTAEYAVVGGK